MLAEYLDQLKKVGLFFESDTASQTDITKKRVVKCLQQIGQRDLANTLSTRQGESCVCTTIRWPHPQNHSVYFNATC